MRFMLRVATTVLALRLLGPHFIPFADRLISSPDPAQWAHQLVNMSQTIAGQITQGLPR